MESAFIEWLRSQVPPHQRLRLGAGDDAAILRMGDASECALAIDTLADGVHFQLDRVEPRRVGRKALAVNLSDMAAMAVVPTAALVSLLLPRAGGLRIAREVFAGVCELADRFDVAVAGGDTNSWRGPLVVTVAIVGQLGPRPPLERGGARPGDRIVVTGRLGGSILGHHLDFEPRVREALLLNEHYRINAAIDVSDGLSTDLRHMAAESRCGAVIETSSVPIADAARALAARDGKTPLEHALCDGEDFELLLAVAPDECHRLLADQPLSVPLTAIGTFEEPTGVWQCDAAGQRTALPDCGYEHPLDP